MQCIKKPPSGLLIFDIRESFCYNHFVKHSRRYSMKPLSEFCCINPNCSEYGKRDNINLKVHQTYGKSDPIRLLECKVCGIMFSERAHTALSGCRLPKDKIISILHHLAEGCGQRRICRYSETTDTHRRCSCQSLA